MQKKYFALEEPKRLVKELRKFVTRWETSVGYGSRGLASVWRRNAQAYFKNILDFDDIDTSLSFEGEQGELIKMMVPQARSVFRQFIGLVTKQKLAFKTVAQSTDAATLQTSRLGDAVVEHIADKESLDAKFERLCEEAGIVGSSFMKCTWRSDRGEKYSRNPDNNEAVYTGDVSIEVCSAMDVLYDYRTVDWDDLDWVMIRCKKNRWDLISQHPHLEEDILKIPPSDASEGVDSLFFGLNQDYDDQIYVYEFYHKDTPAVEGGRQTVFASDTCIFTDGPNPYGFIPVEPMIPEKILFTGMGYPFFSNLLPLQEVLDATISIIATNQQAFGVQQVLVPRGADIDVNDLGPLKFLTYSPQNVNGGGLPQPLQLTSTPPEVFKFIDVVMKHMNDLSLISSVLRGQPPQGVTAASAIATLSANSLQTLEAFSKSGNICLEKIMTKCIKIYEKFADVPKTIEIVGPRKTYMAKEFIGSDLQSISRVRLSVVNPLASQPSGKREIAESLLKMGMLKRPEQYFAVLETGNLDVMYDDDLEEQMNIEAENDMLRDGKPTQALMIDDHARHIACHKSVLSNPEARLNGAMVQATLEHIQQHIDLDRTMDPYLKAILLTGREPQNAPPPPQGAPQGDAAAENQPQPQEAPVGEGG